MNSKMIFLMRIGVFFIVLLYISNAWAQPTITQSTLPQYIQGRNGTNSQRIPCAFLLTIGGLTPNATYRYFNQVVRSSDSPTSNGAGNVIFSNAGGFTRTSSPGMSVAGSYGELTADGAGSYSGWMITEPTGNARFVPGQYIFSRIMLNDGAGGTAIASRLTSQDSVRVLMLGTTGTDSTGTGIRAHTQAAARDFVLLYDNTTGTGRPLAATFIESDGSDNSTANSYIAFYADSVNLIDGAFGTIVPNLCANGVRRVERRSASGSILAFNQSINGIWPSGVNTGNPLGGVTPLVLTVSDVPLTSSQNSPPSITQVNRNPLSPESTSPVTVTARISDSDGAVFSATLFYNAGSGFQSVPMYDDGLHGDSAAADLSYGASIPQQASLSTVLYYIEATDNAGSTVTYPADAPVHTLNYIVDRPLPNVILNEFMAQNTATIQDNDGEWADWVEIVNLGSEALNLAGLSMTDDFANPAKWTFPDTVVAAGGLLLIWCDEDVGDPGVHADFKLSASGEQLMLSDDVGYGGTVLDSLSFGTQSADISYARICDGNPAWDFDSTPTPDASNGLCNPASLTVNASTGEVHLRWEMVARAQYYQVYRLVDPESSIEDGTLVATVTNPEATLTGELDTLTKAFYSVIARRD